MLDRGEFVGVNRSGQAVAATARLCSDFGDELPIVGACLLSHDGRPIIMARMNRITTSV